MTNGGDSAKKKCFVVMGFGEKTDYYSSPPRVLDLNKTFKNIIEPAVTESGLECVRADKIIHSTVIDKPMYENLLDADLVIADLSTSNANALYELGVRHALRPHTTIVIAENGFAFPFDLNHVAIMKYEHMGKDIGYDEVIRMRNDLKAKIAAIIDRGETDSPVFLFLPSLLGKGVAAPEPAAMAEPKDAASHADLMEALRDAKADVKAAEDWLVVVAVANRLKKMQPADHYVIHQLALATYKSQHPDVRQALQKAKEILEPLAPDTSSDPETVGLWGAIHKRLWDVAKDRADLDRAVRAYARGYFIKNDYYNAINFAFLLNVRASVSQGNDAIADRVVARRIREEVLTLCDLAMDTGELSKLDRIAGGGDVVFWANATRVEALLGLGRKAESDQLRQSLIGGQPPPARWMVQSMEDQLAKLAALDP
jgi:MAP3K TRAFs-binding domain